MATDDTLHKGLEAFNRHDAATVAAGYAPSVVVVDPAYPEPLTGRDAVRKDMEDFFRAFPDVQLSFRTLLTDGDTYSVEWSLSGTHKGPFAGPDGEIPATNRSVEMGVAGMGRVDAQGQIVEERRYYDIAGLMAQLGLA